MGSYFFPQLTAAISGVPSLLFSFPTEEESSEVWRAALIHPSRYDLIKTKLQTHIDTFCSDIIVQENQRGVFRLVLHRLISCADSERRKKNLQTEYDYFLFETYRKFGENNRDTFMGMMLCSLLRETSALLDPRLVARQFTNHPAVKKMKTLVEDLIRKMHEASSQLQSEDQEELNFFVELEKVFDSETIKDDVLDSSIQRKILNHIEQVKDLKEKGFVSLSGEESPEDVDFVETVYSYFILSRILGYSIPQNGFEVKRKDVVTGGFILSREFFPNIMYVPANSGGIPFQDGPAFLLSHFITNKRPNPDSPIMKYFNAFLENGDTGNVAAVLAQMIRQNKGVLGETVKVSKNHSRTRHVTGGAGVVDRTPESLSEQLNALRGPVAALIVQSSLLGLEVNAIFKAAYARLFGKLKSGKFSTHSLRQIFDEDIKPMDEIPEIVHRDDDLAEAQAHDMMLTVRPASRAGGHPSSSLALVAQADDKLSEVARLKKYMNILSYLDERAKNAQDSLFPFFTQRRISKIEEVIDVASIASMWSDIQNSFSSNKHFEKWLSEYSKDFRGIYTTWCVLLFSLRMPAIKNVVEALYGARTAHPEYASTKEGSSVFSALVMVMNAPNNQDTKLEFLRRAERLAQSLPDSDSKAVLLQALREVPGHNQQAVRIEGTTSLRQLAAPAPAVYPGQSMYQSQGHPARGQPLRLTDLAAPRD